MHALRQNLKSFADKISQDFIQLQKFSDQSEKYKYKNIQALKNAIQIFSGNEPVAILQKLLHSPNYQPGVFATLNPTHRECLENILQAFNRATTQDEKILVLSLVANTYPSAFLKSFGFIFGSELFACARRYPRYVIRLFFLYFLNLQTHSFFL